LFKAKIKGRADLCDVCNRHQIRGNYDSLFDANSVDSVDLVLNTFGNLECPGFDMVFFYFGTEKLVPVVIGTQSRNNPKEVSGCETILGLTPKDTIFCKANNWNFLTNELLASVKIQNEGWHNSLFKIRNRTKIEKRVCECLVYPSYNKSEDPQHYQDFYHPNSPKCAKFDCKYRGDLVNGKCVKCRREEDRETIKVKRDQIEYLNREIEEMLKKIEGYRKTIMNTENEISVYEAKISEEQSKKCWACGIQFGIEPCNFCRECGQKQ
jgi:hypothetical protein